MTITPLTPETLLYAQCQREMETRAAAGERIQLDMPVPESVGLLAALLEAMRHPAFRGGVLDSALVMAKSLERQLSTTPAIAEAVRRSKLEVLQGGNHA